MFYWEPFNPPTKAEIHKELRKPFKTVDKGCGPSPEVYKAFIEQYLEEEEAFDYLHPLPTFACYLERFPLTPTNFHMNKDDFATCLNIAISRMFFYDEKLTSQLIKNKDMVRRGEIQ